MSRKPNRMPAALRISAAVLFWAAVWEILSLIVRSDLLLPGPVTVFRRLGELCATGSFWLQLGASFLRVLAGLGGGILLGASLAALCERFRWADTLISPAIRVLRTVPVASVIILVLLWVGKNVVPALIAGMMVLPVIWENTRAGIGGADPKLLEMASAYEMRPWARFRYIRLPALLPHLLSGISAGIGLGWKAGAAAEVLCLPGWAIGTRIYESKLYLETVDLFAWTAAVALLSLLIENGVRRGLRKAVEQWNAKT